MKHFTQETLNPKESTILLIKQIAYAYNSVKKKDAIDKSLCFN